MKRIMILLVLLSVVLLSVNNSSAISLDEKKCLTALLEYRTAKIEYRLDKCTLEELEKKEREYLKIRNKLFLENKIKDKFIEKEISTQIAIDHHKPLFGMNNLETEEALGKPDSINRTTGSWGVHEQWIYHSKKMYIYFENGKLTAWQD